MTTTHVHLIAAARPNFMKVAPLYHALVAADDFAVRLVHTGQHYDANMSDAFFSDLGLPEPDYHLGVGSGTHAEQTGGTMIEYEKICFAQRPDWAVVVGDVNATAACAIVCTKLQIPVAHLEAGLRSRDRSMPEEINRLVTDAIADLLWTPSPDADQNLLDEGVPQRRIERVGNIMIDSLELQRANIEASTARQDVGFADEGYGLVTLHRPANVDDREILQVIVKQLVAAAASIELLFPVHPRTRERLDEFDLYHELKDSRGMHLVDPLGYVQFMNLVLGARLVITDSGGIQEESTYLDLPCLTVRPNTERPITITEGTNKLVQPGAIVAEVGQVLAGKWPSGRRPELWDGQTAQRCLASLRREVRERSDT